MNLIIAHQYIEQLNEVVRPAVFGNVGTIVLFRVGAKDAEELESEFTPRFVIEDLVNLKKFDIYLKLMILFPQQHCRRFLKKKKQGIERRSFA